MLPYEEYFYVYPTYDYDPVWWEYPTGYEAAGSGHWEYLQSGYFGDGQGAGTGIEHDKSTTSEEELIGIENVSNVLVTGFQDSQDYISYFYIEFSGEAHAWPVDWTGTLYVDIWDQGQYYGYLGQIGIEISGDQGDGPHIYNAEWSGINWNYDAGEYLVVSFTENWGTAGLTGFMIDWVRLYGYMVYPSLAGWQGKLMGVTNPQAFIGVDKSSIETIMGE